MKRKLASVQTIVSTGPIEGADKIERAQVMGWAVVIKKGEFRAGDRCVFFEVDALLPEGKPWAELMRPRGFRVKTAKLRGVLSQGLALPLTIVPPIDARLDVGDDLTEVLGVKKYEPPVPETLDAEGPFPGMVPKTDEIRLQSALGVLDELRGRPFYISVKCDGTSATFVKADGRLHACSRSWSLKRGKNDYWQVAAKYRLEERIPDGFAVQGELCGPKIQKNRLQLKENDLFVFSVFDVRRGRHLDFREFIAFAKAHALTTVPIERIVEGGEVASFDLSLRNLLKLSKGTYQGTNHRREGIVVRPLVEAPSAVLGGRLSFKVLNDDFLLEDEE